MARPRSLKFGVWKQFLAVTQPCIRWRRKNHSWILHLTRCILDQRVFEAREILEFYHDAVLCIVECASCRRGCADSRAEPEQCGHDGAPRSAGLRPEARRRTTWHCLWATAGFLSTHRAAGHNCHKHVAALSLSGPGQQSRASAALAPTSFKIGGAKSKYSLYPWFTIIKILVFITFIIKILEFVTPYINRFAFPKINY